MPVNLRVASTRFSTLWYRDAAQAEEDAAARGTHGRHSERSADARRTAGSPTPRRQCEAHAVFS